MIQFRLDSRSGISTYLQLVQQVKHALRLGMLEVGDQLPTVREVVAMLVINPNTVLKAYRELEREGLISSRPGQGTFVERTLAGTSPRNQAALRRSLARWMKEAQAAGLDEDSMVAVFTATLRDFLQKVVA